MDIVYSCRKKNSNIPYESEKLYNISISVNELIHIKPPIFNSSPKQFI